MAIKIPGYSNYFGGKSGSGTYQVLINHIPPHDVRFVPFAGMDAITRHCRPARLNVLNDLDERVVAAWRKAVGHDPRFRVLNGDAMELIRACIAQSFDTAETFVYLDPTYRFVTRKGQRPVYRHEMNDNQHLEMLNRALALKHARVMISHYPNDMYDELLAGWNSFDYESITRKGMALERVYYNYTLTDQLHDYSFIGEDFRDRERLSRMKKNFINKLKRLEPQLRRSILQDLAPQISAMSAGTALYAMKPGAQLGTQKNCDVINDPFTGHIADNCGMISTTKA